jgi:hypothetical protein
MIRRPGSKAIRRSDGFMVTRAAAVDLTCPGGHRLIRMFRLLSEQDPSAVQPDDSTFGPHVLVQVSDGRLQFDCKACRDSSELAQSSFVELFEVEADHHRLWLELSEYDTPQRKSGLRTRRSVG